MSHLKQYGEKFLFESVVACQGESWARGVNIAIHRPSVVALNMSPAIPLPNATGVVDYWKQVINVVNEFISSKTGSLMIFGSGQLFSFLSTYTVLINMSGSYYLYDDNKNRFVGTALAVDPKNFKPDGAAIFTFAPNEEILKVLNHMNIRFLVVPGLKV